jgi:hypothetical protein
MFLQVAHFHRFITTRTKAIGAEWKSLLRKKSKLFHLFCHAASRHIDIDKMKV